MELARLVAVSREVGDTRARSRKIALLTDAVRELDATERDVGVAYLAGEPRQDRLDLGPAAVHGVDVPPAERSLLHLLDVDTALQAIADVPAGTGSRTTRVGHLHDLLARATSDEQAWLRALVLRELRQGALAGLLIPAIAAAADVPEVAVRRASMLTGDLRATARLALEGGSAALDEVRLRVGVPLEPMLAATAPHVAAALEGRERVLVEAKLDGARVQVHRDGDHVLVVTRTLHDVTHRVPEVVDAARALPVRSIVLDGEAIAFDRRGRPRPFQETMQRFGRERELAEVRAEVPLEVRFFDVLHLDGGDLLDRPLAERRRALEEVVPSALRTRAVATGSVTEAASFVAEVLRSGHEGAMVKDLSAPYEAGRRGASWRKIKPVHTLDLVVLAAEWGSGRRRGWLSNLHLGCRDDRYGPGAASEGDGLVMLGKTFKGLTDEVLRWQTEALLERETAREGHVVRVRPDLVVEIACDGLVRSTRYPGGVALRFARVKHYRPDKDVDGIEPLSAMLAIHRGERLPEL
jgi:DNA ligase 1